MKRFVLALALMLGLATMAEANFFAGAAFRGRANVRFVAPFNGGYGYGQAAFFGYRQSAFIQPIYYQPQPILLPAPVYGLGLGGCGCDGGAGLYGGGYGGQFRSGALRGMGFGY